ncbi:MAG: ribosome biogenesis GTPase YlqF [Pseudomonadota bacterium]|nr:ribosome biogenesis GTPase YlqF [Pseudomonadota bacterium]
MSIQWFPGHMHTTRKAIAKRVPDIDVVIELLDARAPGSSTSPLLAELTRGKPTLKLLNKQDLADPELTAAWLAHFRQQVATQALAVDANGTAVVRAVLDACRKLAPLRGGMVKPLRLLICGIPNVGKSTLINKLIGRRKAATGDEPGITQTEQQIALASDVTLFDTPGMLWPRIAAEQSGMNLAAIGSIGRNAYDEEAVALALLARLRVRYTAALRERYRIDDIDSLDDAALLSEIGRRRGGLRAGGVVHLQKAAEAVINDLRNGSLGGVTLETPDEVEAWQAAARLRDAVRQTSRRASRPPRVAKPAAPI